MSKMSKSQSHNSLGTTNLNLITPPEFRDPSGRPYFQQARFQMDAASGWKGRAEVFSGLTSSVIEPESFFVGGRDVGEGGNWD